jgi:hypothetical protein
LDEVGSVTTTSSTFSPTAGPRISPMQRLTTIMRRSIVLTVLVAAIAVLGGAGMAAAQPETDPAAPSSVTDSLDNRNDYERSYDDCTTAPADTFGQKLDDWVFGAFGVDDLARSARCADTSSSENPGDALATATEAAASAFWGDPVGDFAKAVMEGNTQAFRSVMTFWMTAGIPGLAAETAMSGLRNIVTGFTVVALFASIVIAMTKLALARKQAVMEGATETAAMLVRTVGAVTFLPVLVLMLHQLGDVMSAYALEKFVGGNLDEKITAITAFDDKTGLGPILALACAGFAVLGSVAQLLALLIREAVLCVVVAVIPLAAAASATNTGRSSYKSMIAFTIGALLFKPVATLLYLFAVWAASASATDQVATVIIGSVLLAVIGFSLPTLIRIVAPAAESISAGGREVAAVSQGTGAVTAGAAGMGSRALGAAARVVAGPSGGGGSGAAGTGARNTAGFQGRYSGSNSSSQAGASSGPMGAAKRVASAAQSAAQTTGRVAQSGTVAGLRGAAGALRATGSGARTVGSAAGNLGAAAEGAVGNYHGRIQR